LCWERVKPMAIKRSLKNELGAWDVDGLIREALEGEEGLRRLISLLRSGDVGLQIRALTALGGVVKNSNWKTRRKILDESLEDLLSAIESGDDRVSRRALEVLGALLKNNPLSDEKLSRVISALLSRARRPSPATWEELLTVADTLRMPYVSDKSTSRLTSAAFFGSPEEAAVASLILLNSGAVPKGDWGRLVERISELLASNDPLLVEAGLKAVDSLTKLPPVFPMGVAVRSLVPTLRKLISTTDDHFIKVRAIEAYDKMRDTVVRYYRVRPDEARKTAEELLNLGLIEEAYMITSAAGFLPGLGFSQGNNRL